MWAARKGHLGVAYFLVENGADIHAKGGVDIFNGDSMKGTPLMEAAQYGHLNVAQYLVERGADVHARGKYGNTALLGAASDGHVDVVLPTLVGSIGFVVFDAHAEKSVLRRSVVQSIFSKDPLPQTPRP
ncbi:hypothetical protein HDU96_006356 [Phlyctochytrium bullatum]|nr:hypothetical protein HDU96_006356 [Phlyctochytrium bullatum]